MSRLYTPPSASRHLRGARLLSTLQASDVHLRRQWRSLRSIGPADVEMVSMDDEAEVVDVRLPNAQ